jgi:uncharacterized protein GlcG (DUF336 family)
VSLTIDLARKILETSKQRARELRSPVSIAIVDAGGHLVLFERMMSPYGWATGNISIAKATTSVMFNQSTDSVAQWGSGIPGFASSLATMTNGKFIMAAGGWPIRLNGTTIGGIGVSGGNAPGRDDDIARAGLAAIDAMAEAMAPPIPVQPPSLSGIAPTPAQPPSLSGIAPASLAFTAPPPTSLYPNMPRPSESSSVQAPANEAPEGEIPSTQHLPAQDDPYPDSYPHNSYNQSNSDRPGGKS